MYYTTKCNTLCLYYISVSSITRTFVTILNILLHILYGLCIYRKNNYCQTWIYCSPYIVTALLLLQLQPFVIILIILKYCIEHNIILQYGNRTIVLYTSHVILCVNNVHHSRHWTRCWGSRGKAVIYLFLPFIARNLN